MWPVNNVLKAQIYMLGCYPNIKLTHRLMACGLVYFQLCLFLCVRSTTFLSPNHVCSLVVNAEVVVVVVLGRL